MGDVDRAQPDRSTARDEELLRLRAGEDRGAWPVAETSDPTREDWPSDAALRGPEVRGFAAWSWLLVLLLISVVLGLHQVGPREAALATAESVEVVVFELQARYVVGFRALMAGVQPQQPLPAAEELLEQLAMFQGGSVGMRLRFAILAGELTGADAAGDRLAELAALIQRRQAEVAADDARAVALCRRWYRQVLAQQQVRDQPPGAADGVEEGAARRAERAWNWLVRELQKLWPGDGWPVAPLDAAEQAWLAERLGWFGRLALHPEGGPDLEGRAEVLERAQRTAVTLLGGVLLVLGLGVVGCLMWMLLGLSWLVGGMRHAGLRPAGGSGGVYAETFAVWLSIFLAGNVAATLAAPPEQMLASIGMVMLLSLSALVWPVLRGIPWQTVRADIGWTWGRAGAWEPGVGILAYGMSLPFVLVGLLGTLFLMGVLAQVQGGPPPDPDALEPLSLPAHPILEQFREGRALVFLQALFLASVAAPLVEETMFRGVLYRHLREGSRGWGTAASVVFSGGVSSFVFAIVHPQGLVAVPVLMSLAFGFVLAREWRDTLWAAMVAHGLNNGLLLGGLMLALS